MFSQQRPADTEMDSLGGLWNLQNDERLEVDGVDPALSKGDGYMVYRNAFSASFYIPLEPVKQWCKTVAKATIQAVVLQIRWEIAAGSKLWSVKPKPAVVMWRWKAYNPGKVL